MRLVPCSACARHVHDTERACPFCGASAGIAAARGDVPFGRMSRAALIFAGATAVAACGKSSPPNGPDTTIAQPYGAPPTPRDAEPTPVVGDGGTTTATATPPPPVVDAGPTPTAIAAPYGAPPIPRDAGAPTPPKKK